MHIILDFTFFSTLETSPSRRSLFSLMLELATRQKDDLFTILSNSSAKQPAYFPSNMKLHPVKTGGWKLAGWKLWKRFMLSKVVNKLGGDLFLTTDASDLATCPCKVCLFDINEGISAQPAPTQANIPGNLFIKTPGQVDGIITFSNPAKEFLQTLVPASANKVHVLRPGVMEEIQPLKWTEKENVKVQYTGGKEYFVFTGELKDEEHLYLLLRAFSRFKKRQLSNMQLVLAGSTTSSTAQFLEKLSSFKYRADVHVFKNPDKIFLQQLIAAAYALVVQGPGDKLQVNAQLAIHSGVPVIKAVDVSSRDKEDYGLMYTPAGSEQGLAEGMQLIYKDENLRTELIKTARQQIESGEKYDMVDACWQLLKVILQTKSQ